MCLSPHCIVFFCLGEGLLTKGHGLLGGKTILSCLHLCVSCGFELPPHF